MWPVRCYSCGFVLAQFQKSFEDKRREGIAPAVALDQLGIKRICCRMRALNPPRYPTGYHPLLNDIEQVTQQLARTQVTAPHTTQAGGVLQAMQTGATTVVPPTPLPTTTNGTLTLGMRTQINVPQVPQVQAKTRKTIRRVDAR